MAIVLFLPGDHGVLADPSDESNDPATRRGGCPRADPSLALQYRAALLHLRSEGVRRVIQLQRRVASCPGADGVTTALLRETGLRRLGEPLVVSGGAGWEQLHRWGSRAAEDVAVLVEDAELLEESVGRKEAVWWKDAIWYAPTVELGNSGEKLRFNQEFKIITTRVASSEQDLLSDEMASSETPNLYFDPGIGGFRYNISDIGPRNTRQRLPVSSGLPAEAPAGRPSVLLARWAPAPPSSLPLLEVLRASPWLLAGVFRPGRSSVEPPAALLVQRSQLGAQLSAAGCDTWQAELSGADPLTGAPLWRSYTEHTLPAVAALQGAGPLAVEVRCPRLSAALRCLVEMERQTCHWEEMRVSRRRRATGASRSLQRTGRWQPTRWRGDDYRRAGRQQQTDGVWQAVPVTQRAETARPPAATPSQRRAETDTQTWQRTEPNPQHRTGVAQPEYEPQHYSHDPYAEYSSDTHAGVYSGDTYLTYGGDTYPVVYDLHAERRRDRPSQSADRMREKLHLAILPSLTSCGGAIAGCFTCITVLTLLPTGVNPAACIGPCSIGGGTACSGAAGTFYREYRKIQTMQARRRRRRLGARSQRRLGRLAARG